MIQAEVYDIKGKKVGTKELDADVFGVKPRPALVAQAARVYLSNKRKAYPKTKRRGEVRGSTIKIYRQKGTGRARHGDRQAPIFVKGGIAHGPRGNQNFKKKMSRKMNRLAFFSALSVKAKEKKIIIIKDFDKIEAKTGHLSDLFTNVGFDLDKLKVFVIFPNKWENIKRGGRNIKNIFLKQPESLNTYETLLADRLVFAEESLPALRKRLIKQPAIQPKEKKDNK